MIWSRKSQAPWLSRFHCSKFGFAQASKYEKMKTSFHSVAGLHLKLAMLFHVVSVISGAQG